MAATWADVLEADDPKATLETMSRVTLLGFCKLKGIGVNDLDLAEGEADLIAQLLPHVESELAEVGVSRRSISAKRHWMRDKFESASERARIAKTQDGAAGSAIRVTGKAASRSKKLLRSAASTAVDKSAQLMSLETYRAELEQLLDEAVRVIAVQEDRIARLEEKLRDLNT